MRRLVLMLAWLMCCCAGNSRSLEPVPAAEAQSWTQWTEQYVASLAPCPPSTAIVRVFVGGPCTLLECFTRACCNGCMPELHVAGVNETIPASWPDQQAMDCHVDVVQATLSQHTFGYVAGVGVCRR